MVPKCDRHCADTWDAGSKLRDLLGMIFQIYSPAIHPFKWSNHVEASKVVRHILRGTGEVESQAYIYIFLDWYSMLASRHLICRIYTYLHAEVGAMVERVQQLVHHASETGGDGV